MNPLNKNIKETTKILNNSKLIIEEKNRYFINIPYPYMLYYILCQ